MPNPSSSQVGGTTTRQAAESGSAARALGLIQFDRKKRVHASPVILPTIVQVRHTARGEPSRSLAGQRPGSLGLQAQERALAAGRQVSNDMAGWGREMTNAIRRIGEECLAPVRD
jgi:hypothetical protein